MDKPDITSSGFKEIDIQSITDNTFKLIENDWFLITAGSKEHFNTMTANWGGFGFLWHKKVCFIFVRPTRYTFEFTEDNEFFTLSFFDEAYREALDFCGSHSGKDIDKAEKCGLSVIQMPDYGIAFNEARIIFACKKIYQQDIDPENFIDRTIDKNYPKKDYHRMYIGEIIKVYAK